MAPDPNTLEHVFNLLGHFAFDRVKELCDKEKDFTKNPQGLHLVWSQFMGSLSQLSPAEKGYATLIFLTQTPNNPKAFRKKELPLRLMYGQIKQDLEKVAELIDSLPEPEETSAISMAVLGHLSVQLGYLAAARLDMCDIYERLHEMGITHANKLTDSMNLIEQVLATYGKKFHHPLLTALESSFTYETDVLKHLIDAQLEMGKWNFMGSLIHLSHANRIITSWPTVMQTSVDIGFPSLKLQPHRNVAFPALYLWFVRYQSTLLAKFSLYFYDILAKQTGNPTEFKSLLARNSPDYYQKIVTFHRKSDASSICILLDTNGMVYRGPGYRSPDDVLDSPRGLDSYPAIFSFPMERPTKHWPSVVMTLIGETKRLDELDAIVSVTDKDLERSYFISKIEEGFYIVLIYEIRKSEKDSAVNQFIIDIVNHLRGSRVLESLKPV